MIRLASTCVLMLALAAITHPAAWARPPAPHAASPGPVTSRELVEATGLSGLEVSPDGKYAVVRIDRQDLSANRTILSWRIIRIDDAMSIATFDAGAPRWNANGNLAPEAPQWSGDSEWVYFRKLVSQELQVWRISRDGQREEQVTFDAADVRVFMVGEGDAVHYAAGPATREEILAAEAIEHDTGVLLDAGIIKGFPITGSFPVNGRMTTYRRMPNGERAPLLGNTPLRSFTIPARHGEPVPATEAIAARLVELWSGSNVENSPVDPGRESRATSPDGAHVARFAPAAADDAASRHASRSGYDLVVDSANAGVRRCVHEACRDADDLTLAGWMADGGHVVFQTRRFDMFALHVWDVRTGQVRTLLRGDRTLGDHESGQGGECRIAGKEAICLAAGPSAPPRVIAVDLESGDTRILLDPNPTLSTDRLGASTPIVLHDRFGATTFGRLILPRAYRPGTPIPLVITSYTCGGFLQGGSGRDVPEHVLAGLGYAAICVDLSFDIVRRPQSFRLTQANITASNVDFFESAAATLVGMGIADPDRVALAGFSASATGTTSAITRTRRFTAAIVTTEGSLDPIVCYLATQYSNCEGWKTVDGTPRPYDRETGELLGTPALDADAIVTPLLMQLPEVEYMTMMQLYDAMSDRGLAVEMHIFAGAYHFKNAPRQRLAVYDRNLDWLGFWLRGEESYRADRRTQNARWRSLREGHCRALGGRPGPVSLPWYCRAPAAPSEE